MSLGERKCADMQIPVLVKKIDGNGYRARSAEPFALVANGPTREAALAKLKELVQARLRQGAEIVSMDLGQEPHPFAEFVGMDLINETILAHKNLPDFAALKLWNDAASFRHDV